MKSGALGKVYKDTEIIIAQGERGDKLYVILEGQVEIVKELTDGKVQLAMLGKGEMFGEMAVFEGKVRSATARALGEAQVLTIDKKNFLRAVHEDPTLAFHLMQIMSARIRELGAEMSLLRIMHDESSAQSES